MRIQAVLVVILSLWLNFACSSDEQGPAVNDLQQDDTTLPLEASITVDIPYGTKPGQTYDLYLPAGRSSVNTKVIVLIHGGGWVSGDKSDMEDYVDLFRERLPEYALVNLNYELADINTPAFPNQFLDVKTALEQLQEQATELAINPEFALIGASAGAHISLMMDYVYDTQDRVKMVCSIVGPTDFTDPFYSEDPQHQLLLNLLTDESAYAANTDYAQATSPVYQVNSSSSPTIMFYGNADPLVPLSNGTSLENALTTNSISHSFTIYEGGHGNDWSPENYVNLQDQLIAYLLEYLPVNP